MLRDTDFDMAGRIGEKWRIYVYVHGRHLGPSPQITNLFADACTAQSKSGGTALGPAARSLTGVFYGEAFLRMMGR